MNMRPLLSLMAVAVLAAACASPAAPTAKPPSVSSPGPSQSGAEGTMTLRVAPADLGCDAMPVAYRRVVFQIDPAAEEPVTAQTDTGKSLQTFWSAGFVGVTDGPAVKDPSGQVVAANGEGLDIPEGALPRLHGYFVCPSDNALYVLLKDPS
ncbi:MAG TPA: hypothetical protein VFN41_06150 [Candidatus Limnocylindrales bacterium]|nr:hypothetical protein [Candidatus Limnocylindrales bacterium]